MEYSQVHSTRALPLRITAFFLVFALSFTIFPTAVFASDTEIDPDTRFALTSPASSPSLAEISEEGTFAAPYESLLPADFSQEFGPVRDENAVPVRELLSERSQTAKIYQLSDGYFETIVGARPVHFKDERGRYIDLATNLIPSAETSMTFGGYSTLSTSENVAVASFGDSGKLSLSAGSWRLSLGYANTSPTLPLIMGDIAYFADIAPGKDIEYQALWWGIKETLILTAPTTEHTFDFRLTFEGLKLTQDVQTQDFHLVCLQSDEIVLDIGQLIVHDSNFDEKLGEFAACDNAQWELVESGENFATLRAAVDADWIRDAQRVWPVRIDPPIILKTQSFNDPAAFDNWTTSRYPTNSYSNTAEMRVGYFDATTGHNRGHLRFAIPNLAGSRIDSAIVRVHQYHQYYVNGSAITYIADATRAPAANDTWNNMPGAAAWNIANFTTTTRVQEVPFDVAPRLRTRIAAGQTIPGFILYQSENGSQNTTHWRRYRSVRHGSSQPTMRIVFYPDIKNVTGLSYTTEPSSEWFREVDIDGNLNLNDRAEQGRGIINLSWNADAHARGYLIYAFDGNEYQVVGKTVGRTSTSWSSAGSGAYPSDSEIAGYTQDTGVNTLIGANTPSDESKLSRTALVYPPGAGISPVGAGVVAFDGTDMYVKKWGVSPGPDQWLQFKKTGMTDTLPTYSSGRRIATTLPGSNARSAFVLDGILYCGQTTRVSAGTADISGFVLSSIMDRAVPVTLTLSRPPLGRHTAQDVSGPSSDILLASCGNYIYSAGRASTSQNIIVRTYDSSGTFVSDRTVALTSQSAYTNLNGFATDGINFYFYEWGGERRVTKVSVATGQISNQWHVDTQPADRTVSLAFDKVHHRFVSGQLDQAGIVSYRGPGLDFRDDPRPLYQKTKGRAHDNDTFHRFRVAPYSDFETPHITQVSAQVNPTLENRTVRVSDAAQRSYEPLAEIAGEVVEGALAEPATRLLATDLIIDSPGPVAALVRTHLSDGSFESNFLPEGWMFGFEENIELSSEAALYLSPEGKYYSFKRTADDIFFTPNGMQATLVYFPGEESEEYVHDDAGCRLITINEPGLFELRYYDGRTKVFDQATGTLLYEEDRQGRRTSYDISGGIVIITAHNERSIVLQARDLYKNEIDAQYITQAGQRKVTYSKATDSLSVHAYPNTSAAITRHYSMDGSLLVSVSTEGDTVSIDYDTSSLSVEHTANDVPPRRHTLTFESTADPTVRRTILERGSQSAERGFEAGYERFEYLTNLAKQTVWASISDKAQEGVHLRYNAENQMIGTQAPTVASFDSNNKVSYGRKETTTQIIEELFTYDRWGNLINHSNRYGGHEEYFYNKDNELIKTIDAGRGVSWFSYDTKGRLSVEERLVGTSGKRARTEYSYNADSNLIQTRRAIRQIEDEFEWETIQYTDHAPNGMPQKTVHKGVQLSAHTAPQDIITFDEFDDFGNHIEQIMPLGTTTQMDYDIAGRMTAQTTADGVTQHIVYDSAARVSESYKTSTNLSGKHDWIEEDYDLSGNNKATRFLAPCGEEISRIDRRFDTLGREIAFDDSDIKGEETVKYDEVGNVTEVSEEGAADIVFDLTEYD
ncbi:MAG: DNRLRE domain-containing protein, partial [Coriobacteriia bacterium]|nr:DNRLRE domain-containing protein [Coriobacteriia bacterium]